MGVQKASYDPYFLQFELAVSLPAGTFATDDLPPSLDFLPLGRSFVSSYFRYTIKNADGGFATFGGATDWLADCIRAY